MPHHATIHHMTVHQGKWWLWRRVVTKGSGDAGSGDEGKWWPRERVTKVRGDLGKWWWRECGNFWKWRLREVLTYREMVTLGSGVVTKLWLHDCVRGAAKRSVLAAWTLHGTCVCVWEEAGAWNPAFFRVKWLQPAMTGSSCVRRVRTDHFDVWLVLPWCSATCGCSGA